MFFIVGREWLQRRLGLISKNFHCDAIIPIVKLFWCVALEPIAGSKCKPGHIGAGGFGFDFWAGTGRLVSYNTSGREVLGSIFGPVPAVSSVVKRTGYWCGRSGVRLPVWSNRHSVANSLPLLRRFCVTQALRDGPQ